MVTSKVTRYVIQHQVIVVVVETVRDLSPNSPRAKDDTFLVVFTSNHTE